MSHLLPRRETHFYVRLGILQINTSEVDKRRYMCPETCDIPLFHYDTYDFEILLSFKATVGRLPRVFMAVVQVHLNSRITEMSEKLPHRQATGIISCIRKVHV